MLIHVSRLPPFADYLNEQLFICRRDKRADFGHIGHLLHALHGDKGGASLMAVKKEQKLGPDEFEIFLIDCLHHYALFLERACEQLEQTELARRWSWFLHGCQLAEVDPEEVASVALFEKARQWPKNQP
jgi:hypothetical protein